MNTRWWNVFFCSATCLWLVRIGVVAIGYALHGGEPEEVSYRLMHAPAYTSKEQAIVVAIATLLGGIGSAILAIKELRRPRRG